MARMRLNELPRIVCPKCVRIVRVHWFTSDPMRDMVMLATECCQRLFGRLHQELITEAAMGTGRSLTTDDILAVGGDCVESANGDGLAQFIERCEEIIAEDSKRLHWARWALEKS